MDLTIPTPTVCSTVTSSSVSSQAPPPTPLQILEISLISAQDLAPITKSMSTYAVAWINPNKKITTRTEQGHTNPKWNQKFTFRINNNVLLSENTTLTVEIYTTSWFRNILVGTISVLMSDLIMPSAKITQNHLKNTRFIALQVRRPSGTPQGIFNMGVALLDNTMRSMPLRDYAINYSYINNFHDGIDKKLNSLYLAQQNNGNQEDEKRELKFWRSLSVRYDITNEDFPMKQGSIVNDSELCSDIGPSASIVAADLANKSQPPFSHPSHDYRNPRVEEPGGSILEELTLEEAKAKGYKMSTNRDRWRKVISMTQSNIDDCDESELLNNNMQRSRRNSDSGMFSCFGNAYGIEFTIVCGANNNTSGSKQNDAKSRRKNSSEANSV